MSQQPMQSQQFEDDEMYAGPAGAKAKITRKRYTREMIVMLLEIVDEVLPYGNKDWEVVAAKYNQIFSDDRDYVSVRKKYFDLVPKGVPVPLQTAENLRADLVQKRIHIRQQTGIIPPPTPPDVLVALYTNSNLPLPGYLRSYVQNNPMSNTTNSNTNNTTSNNNVNSNIENDVSVSTSPDGNSQQPSSVLGKRKSNSDSLLNLSTLSNNNTTNNSNNNNNNGNNNIANVSTVLSPPNNFIASTAAITASMANTLANNNNNNANNNSVKNEDYQQYCANPQLFKPSPIGAGLSMILYKILQSSSLKNTSPTLLPAKVPLRDAALNAEEGNNPDTALMVTLANLARKRKNGVLLTELGKLEGILLELYTAHEKLGVYMAEHMQEIISNHENVENENDNNDTNNTDSHVDTQKDETGDPEIKTGTAETANVNATNVNISEMQCMGPELTQLNAVYTTSYACAQQVAQWLDTYRPQYKKLKLTPYQLQKMKRSGSISANSASHNNLKSSTTLSGGANKGPGARLGDKDEKKGTSSVDEEEGDEEEDEEEDVEEEDEENEEGVKKEIEDEAADDFEDLYVGKTTATTAMDTD